MQGIEKIRHELKYLISTMDYWSLRSQLKSVMSRDPHSNSNGQYQVRSLYFDDPAQTCLEEKILGLPNRKKYRFRYYNFDPTSLKLECKQKFNQWIQKTSCALSFADCEEVLTRKNLELRIYPQPLMKKFLHEKKHRLLAPAVIVDFIREAYTLPYQEIRITFDQALKTAIYSQDFFNQEIPSLSILPPGKMILEIKFSRFLPEHIKKLLPCASAQRQAISKFALSRLAI